MFHSVTRLRDFSHLREARDKAGNVITESVELSLNFLDPVLANILLPRKETLFLK